ncbi:efflux RND transporter periplasmic adaptor subunit [Candidatus Protochlamydia phocaeensis]|uniref:efflux RND transporter periplasmic adaptor subunit n=1 Tax=Candidatus Protochlamydia phocaeensis TaxID=1414722 RepID=UPI0008385E1A|nr:efflux RND transporter periplasmic adaptor subunit [Candidatus Protochlamydia phocaeensis]
MKKIFSYGFAILFGAALASVISLYWEDMNSQLGGFMQSQPPKEIAEAEEEKEQKQSEEDPHHDENIVELSEDQIQKMRLIFKPAGPGKLLFTLSTRGKIILQPDHLAHIIPKVSGVAREANKNIGNFVKAGDVMAILESRDIADVKASYLAALSKQRLAISALEREERLYKEKVSAEQDYLNAKNVYEESMINVQLARQKLRADGLSDEEIQHLTDQADPDLRTYQIRSPIDGTVIMRHITKGEFVKNTTTIYEVADLSTVWVEIGIYPKDLYRVKEGQLVDVMIPIENKGAQARLIYVSPIIAEETITAKAIAELDNPQGIWRPGVFVNVTIATEEATFPLVIPKEAVQNSDGKDFVFVSTPNGLERRFVKLGRSDNENIEIVSGLKPGEQYVADKTFLLKAELEKSSAEDEH